MKKIVMLLMLLLIPINVNAKTLQDLYDELADLKANYNEALNNKNLTQQEINNLNSEITSIYTKINNTQQEIVKAEKKITDNEKTIEDKKQESNELLKYLQISNGENTYLEYLFSSEDYTDFIYRYSIIEQLTEYNENTMKSLEKAIKDLEQSKIDLANKQKQLENDKVNLISKRSKFESNLSTYTTEGTTIEQDIKDLQEDIKYYEDNGCKRNENLSTCAGIPYASGWKYPLNYGVITSNFGWRSFMLNGKNKTDYHTGIDIGGNAEGTKIYAAASGTVARLVYKASCGGNMVYVYHNVKGKAYTTVYMHLLSINVSMGQSVYDTSVIGTVGGGPKTFGWERCSTGAHLHFGMATGHNAYSFNSYIFDPDTVFNKLSFQGASFNYR